MKNLFLLVLFGISFCSFGQETLYKNYKVTNFIDFLNDSIHDYDYDNLDKKQMYRVKFLLKEKCSSYDDLLAENKAEIDAKFNLVEKGIIPSMELKDCAGNSFIIDKSNVNNLATKKLIGMSEILRV